MISALGSLSFLTQDHRLSHSDMAVHIFDAEDSDGDSWMEVVEGSPGPSIRNSSASLPYNRDEKVDSTRKTASWVADDTWVSEFEEYKDIKGDRDNSKL